MADKIKVLDELKLPPEILTEIGDEYEKGQQEIARIVEENVDQTLTVKKKQQIMAAITVVVAGLSAKTDNFLTTAIPMSYKAGTSSVDKILKIKEPLGKDHLEIVNSLIDDAGTRLKLGLNTAQRDVETILSNVVQRQVTDRLSKVKLESVDQIAKDVKKIIEKDGITSLVARDGKRLNLDAYSRMVARTEISNAANQGVLNRAAQFGVDIVQVSQHAGVRAGDDACLDNQGKIFSISGNSSEYPKLEASNTPPYHPNCLHVLIARPYL